MKTLYTVEICEDVFPDLSECTKEIEMELIRVGNEVDTIELVIESAEPNNTEDPEFQAPNYVVYIKKYDETIDRLVHPYDFEEMGIGEMISTLVTLFEEKYIKNEVAPENKWEIEI